MAKPPAKMPTRMSAPKIEDTKPSKLIAVFWWIVFIVPVWFVWWSTGSIIGVVILIAIRILIMYIPKFWKREQKTDIDIPDSPKLLPETINTSESVLSPYIDEARSEWGDLLKTMRIYDKEKEEKNLDAYRKLRGWE